ncbi:MAG TPA: LysR family transcriptional regulator, partial [Thiolapillus brandeum]|nr:LysR family transcriptional regulator [Thiolapillus brandeum]
MNLTDTGKVYYQDCVRILDEILETELAAGQAHGTLKGKLKVALPSSFGLMHIGPAINEFLQAHPQIRFELDFNDREVDLMQEGFDLAIRIANLPDSSLIARRIAPIESLLCASPAYLERMGTPQSPEELIHHQCMVYSLLRNFESWRLINPEGQKIRVKLQPYLIASSGEYLLEATVEGHGIALLPTFIAHREIERGSLVTLFSEYRSPRLNAYTIYPQTRYLSQRVRAFVDFLVERFQGTPYWDNY